MRRLLLAATLLTLPGVAGCGGADAAIVEAEVKVTVCAPSGQQCFSLPLPEAAVEVTTPAGDLVGTGRTDGRGIASVEVRTFGDLIVVATSPVLENGRATAKAPGLVAGGASSVSLWAAMAPELESPADRAG